MLGSGTWERWAREAVHREKDCEKHCVIEKSAAYAQKCIFQVPSDENLLRNGLLHANRVAPCNVMACQEGLGPSLQNCEHPTKTHRSDSEPRAWLPPPRCPRPCATLPAPRLCLRHASTCRLRRTSTCRLRRTCVVDSLTHTQRSILPASAPVLFLRP